MTRFQTERMNYQDETYPLEESLHYAVVRSNSNSKIKNTFIEITNYAQYPVDSMIMINRCYYRSY